MPIKPTGMSPRRAVMTALVAVTVVAAVVFSYLQTAAVTAESAGQQAQDRLKNDVSLATKYKGMSAEMLQVSDNVNDARSSGFLQDALKRHGMPSPTINPGEPQQSSDSVLPHVYTTVTFGPTPLSGVIGFIHDVETTRANLSLVEVRIDRQGDADAWTSPGIRYVALMRKQ
jgi:hypothetical protein